MNRSPVGTTPHCAVPTARIFPQNGERPFARDDSIGIERESATLLPRHGAVAVCMPRQMRRAPRRSLLSRRDLENHTGLARPSAGCRPIDSPLGIQSHAAPRTRPVVASGKRVEIGLAPLAA